MMIGVLRAVIDPDHGDPEITGRLEIVADDDEIIGRHVLYTFDRGRLLDMFAAARAGATDDDLLLALDAAALAEPDESSA
jgi:hypothetical protein